MGHVAYRGVCANLGLRTFRWALDPTKKHTFVTDHYALKWLRDCVKAETPGHRQLMRFALELEEAGPFLIAHRAGKLNGAPDGLSRVVATDKTRDGRRDRDDMAGPAPNLWEDVNAVTEEYFKSVLREAIPLCEADPA